MTRTRIMTKGLIQEKPRIRKTRTPITLCSPTVVTNGTAGNQQKLLLLNLTHTNAIDFIKGILFCDMLYIETGLQFTYIVSAVPVIKELMCFSQKHSGHRA